VGETLEGAPRVEKTTFSAWAEPQFRKEVLSLGRHQIWLCGVETHVGILQTSLQMQEAGFRVWLFADAVSSREKLQWRTALNFLQEMGVRIITSEMLAFALLERAGTDVFHRLAPFLE
jgi:nicotinamidase-related amidase